jgi:starch synthase (maltosyl-transferring)
MRNASSPTSANASPARRPYEQIAIEHVAPSIEGGRFPVKAVVGDTLRVEATVFRHGHEKIRVALRVVKPGDTRVHEIPMAVANPGLDLWAADLSLDTIGRHRFTVAAWTDHFGSWLHELQKRVDAAQPDVASEIAEGLAQVDRAAAAASGDVRQQALQLAQRLADIRADASAVLALAQDPETLDLMARTAPRDDGTSWKPELELVVDRERARFGAWYELFIRSQGDSPDRSATFADAERRLPALRDLGFDVVYLAPIHPIGTTKRKGRNNSVVAAPGDPGSPWAIGSAAGGHTAIEPSIGTIDDFDRFVHTAHAHEMEVALDLALQCSPDHPWVTEHPDWFYRRPDGSIRYAENPPKKYEDIYPLNFDTRDWQNLWAELRDVVRFWISHGVKIFRVDNPHTKPLGFWSWLIESIHAESPDVIFLAEAFTRPPMMQGLARRGFTQSYTYFTWRNTKAELTTYLTELTSPASALAFRPNFFANTPDILPPILQTGSPAAFKTRLLLAATLSPSYGIYSGFELCEHEPVPGREEYLHSEKYEIKIRDWNAPGNLNDFIRRVNQARQANRALQLFTNLQFLDVPDPHLLAYAKTTPDGSNTVIVVVNLDPASVRTSLVSVPESIGGVRAGGTFRVRDALTDATFTWGASNYVRLDPVAGEPAHLLIVERGR